MNTQYNKVNSTGEICVKSHKGKYFSWSAIIAGALVGLGISFLLNLFAVAIGLTAFVTSTTASTLSFAIGGFLGLLIAAIVSMGALGWTAGYLGALKNTSCHGDIIHCNYGSLYGFTAWSLALILSIFISAHVGKFLSYTVAALANPTVAVENYTSPQNTNVKATVTQSNNTTDSTTVNSEEAKKALATSSFIAFVLFFVGAFSASLVGHIAFARCVEKHGKRIE